MEEVFTMASDARAKLEKYIPLAEFLSRCYGDNVEVVLHDISDLDHSAIAIFNSHVSGRKTGAPMTAYGLKIIRERLYTEQNYSVDTQNVLSNGKVLRSSTYFITDDDGELLGTLCINVDVSHYVEMGKMIERMVYGISGRAAADEEPDRASAPKETFPDTVDDLIDATVTEFIGENGNISDLTPERKIELVSNLNEKGIFMFKGTVRKVSSVLGVSEPTVYRYLNIANQNNS